MKRAIKTASALFLSALALAGCSTTPNYIDNDASLHSVSLSTSHENTTIEKNETFYVVDGKAQADHNPEKGHFYYGEKDKYGRATGAYASLTHSVFTKEKNQERENISHLKPTGWVGCGAQQKYAVTITSDNGKYAYKGCFYNRSHLIADSLGGAGVIENLVTGTRNQNVGWNNDNKAPDGGMQYAEKKVSAFLTTNDDSCPVYYAVTPNYKGTEGIARTVTIDMKTCEASLENKTGFDERIIVSNYAPGYTINYNNGAYTKTR